MTRFEDRKDMKLVLLTDGVLVYEYVMPEWMTFVFLKFFEREANLYGVKADIKEFMKYYREYVPDVFKMEKDEPEALIKRLTSIRVRLDNGEEMRICMN